MVVMTDLPTPPPAVVPDRIEASGGPIQVLPPIEGLTGTGSPLLNMRDNQELSLTGENFSRFRCCGGPLARGWIDVCSPRYTGDLGPDGAPLAAQQRFDPNVEGGGITSVLDADHKCSETCWGRQTFEPFTFYNMQDVDCITPTFDLQTEARLQVERNTAWWVTAELDRSPLSGNPSFRSFGWDLTPDAGPVAVAQALTILMRAYSTQGMGALVLHIPWWSLPVFEAKDMIVTRGGQLRTVSGIPIIAGPGYSGVLPDLDATGTTKTNPVDETAPNRGEVAFYATRSVPEYRLGPVDDYPVDPQDLRRVNHLNAESYRTAALRFDPGCVYAVAVNVDQGVC